MNADEFGRNRTLCERWEYHWSHQSRTRLDGLTDDECFWSSVADPKRVAARQLDGVSVRLGAGTSRWTTLSPAGLLRRLLPAHETATNGATR